MEIIDPDNADLFDGFGNGSLHLYVVCTPDWKPYRNGNVRYLELDFHDSDWEALLWKELRAGEVHYEEYGRPDEDYEKIVERNRKRFQQSISEYPMLARIYDMYEDYLYTPEEITKLRDECLLLKLNLTESNAVKALRKLIYACDEASKAGCNLMFVCD